MSFPASPLSNFPIETIDSQIDDFKTLTSAVSIVNSNQLVVIQKPLSPLSSSLTTTLRGDLSHRTFQLHSQVASTTPWNNEQSDFKMYYTSQYAMPQEDGLVIESPQGNILFKFPQPTAQLSPPNKLYEQPDHMQYTTSPLFRDMPGSFAEIPDSDKVWNDLIGYTDYNKSIEFHFFPPPSSTDTVALTLDNLCLIRIPQLKIVFCVQDPFLQSKRVNHVSSKNAYLKSLTGRETWFERLDGFIKNRLFIAAGSSATNYLTIPLHPYFNESMEFDKSEHEIYAYLSTTKKYLIYNRMRTEKYVSTDITDVNIIASIATNKKLVNYSSTSIRSLNNIVSILDTVPPNRDMVQVPTSYSKVSTDAQSLTINRGKTSQSPSSAFTLHFTATPETSLGKCDGLERVDIYPGNASGELDTLPLTIMNQGLPNLGCSVWNIDESRINTQNWIKTSKVAILPHWKRMTKEENILYQPFVGYSIPPTATTLAPNIIITVGPYSGYNVRDNQCGVELYFEPDAIVEENNDGSFISLVKLLFIRITDYNIIICVNTPTRDPLTGTYGGLCWLQTKSFVRDYMMIPMGRDNNSDRALIPFRFGWDSTPLNSSVGLTKFYISGQEYSYDSLTLYKGMDVHTQIDRAVDSYTNAITGLERAPTFFNNSHMYGYDSYFSQLTAAVTMPTFTSSKLGALNVKYIPNELVQSKYNTDITIPFHSVFEASIDPTNEVSYFATLFIDPRRKHSDETNEYGSNRIAEISVSNQRKLTIRNLRVNDGWTFTLTAEGLHISSSVTDGTIDSWATNNSYAPLLGFSNVRQLTGVGDFPIEFYFTPNQTNPLRTLSFDDLCFIRLPLINVIYSVTPCPRVFRCKNYDEKKWWTKPHLFESHTLYTPVGTKHTGVVSTPFPLTWVPFPTKVPKINFTIGKTSPATYDYDGRGVKISTDPLGDSIPDDDSSSSSSIFHDWIFILAGIIILLIVGFYFFKSTSTYTGSQEDDNENDFRVRRRRSKRNNTKTKQSNSSKSSKTVE